MRFQIHQNSRCYLESGYEDSHAVNMSPLYWDDVTSVTVSSSRLKNLTSKRLAEIFGCQAAAYPSRSHVQLQYEACQSSRHAVMMDQRSWSYPDIDGLGATHTFGTSCTYRVSDSSLSTRHTDPSFVHSTTTSHTGLFQWAVGKSVVRASSLQSRLI